MLCVLSMVLFEHSELTSMSVIKGAWNVNPDLLWNMSQPYTLLPVIWKAGSMSSVTVVTFILL